MNHRLYVPALALSAALVIAACGGRGGPGASPTPGGSPASSGAPGTSLSGEIAISGSSTVQPISQEVQRRFNEQHPEVAISVDGPGTGDGFKLFCAGETDISDASRRIKDEEAAACKAAGVDYVELKVAIDGLSILTSTRNDQIECLSFEDLYALVGPESQGFTNWKQAEPLARALGSKTTYPDAPLAVNGPGEESGTFDSFVEIVIEKIAKARGKESTTRPDYASSANDNVIVDGVDESPTSLGWVGYAYAEENADRVKLLQVDGGEGCVAPTPDTISSGRYPIARDLYLYVNTAKAETNPALAAFVGFYLAEGTLDAVLEEVPYVPLAADALAATRASWADR